MRILITGGAGFIGSHVAQAAFDAGHEVAVLDNLSHGKKENIQDGWKFYEVDLRDAEAMEKCMQEFKPDAVSHHAAQASVSYSVRHPREDAEINLVGTLNLLSSCQSVGCKKFVFASTGGAIYGEVEPGAKAPVGMAPNPLSPYACSKLAAEHYITSYQALGLIDATILRYANVYGPRQDPHGEAGVIAIFLKRFLQEEGIQLFARREQGDAGCVRDYVYVGDVVKANMAAILGSHELPSILNVCTGQGTTTGDLASSLMNILDCKVPVEHKGIRPGDVEYAVLDESEFSSIFGQPFNIEDGLAKTAEFFKAEVSG